MPHVLSCRIASYGAFQHLAWEHLSSIGVPYVEAPAPEDSDGIDALQQRLAQSGLKAMSLQGKCDFVSPNAVEQVDVAARACAALDVRYLFLSLKRGEMEPQAAYDRLRRLGDAAAHHGVTIILETHPDLATNGDIARQTLAATDHPHVRLNYDTANVYYYNHGVTAEGELAKAIDLVGAVHLKDTGGGFHAWDFPALGQGVVDFPTVFRMLDNHGFTGPYTMELEGQKGVEYTETTRLAMVADSVAYLRQQGFI